MSDELQKSTQIILPSQEMTFEDCEPQEIPVNIKGRDGKVKKYLLKEGMEDVNCKYQNFITSQHKIGSDGSILSIGNVSDADPYLVHLCLYELIPSKDNPDLYTHKKVPLEVVRSWPTPRVRQLYEKAKEINHIEVEDLTNLKKQRDRLDERIAKLEGREEKLKNGQDATTTSSE